MGIHEAIDDRGRNSTRTVMGCLSSRCKDSDRDTSLPFSYDPDEVDGNVKLKSYRQDQYQYQGTGGGEEKSTGTTQDEIVMEDIVLSNTSPQNTATPLSLVSSDLNSLDHSMIPCPGSRCDAIDRTDDTSSEYSVIELDDPQISSTNDVNEKNVVLSECGVRDGAISALDHAEKNHAAVEDQGSVNTECPVIAVVGDQSYENEVFDSDEIEEKVVRQFITVHQV